MIRAIFLLAAITLLPAAHAQTPTDACSLLTPDQIKAVIHTPVEPGQAGVAKGSNECTWSDASGPNPGPDRVYIALRPGADFRTIRTQIDKNGGHSSPVTGLGDDAFLISDESSSALYVLAKNHFLLLTVTLPDPTEPATEAAEKTLAAQILARL